MADQKFFRMVFVGGFGTFFLWHLLLILGFVPILGSWLAFLFMKWLTRNTVLVPFDMRTEDVQRVMEGAAATEAIERELK
jgi:hypothetical protein